MIRIKLVQQRATRTDGALDLDERLLSALEAIQHTGFVSQSANTLGGSYRFL
jgi:molybdenum-dependent DNA-binding transcriptional regulator ModE